MAHEQLCSEFVAVRVETARGRVVETLGILEEISATGATIQLERPVAIGDRLELVCGNCPQACRFKGRVTRCRRQPALGHFAVVRFEEGTRWSPDRYSPQHLFDPDRLVEGSSAAGGCEPGPCANQVVCRVLTRKASLKRNVRIGGN